MQNESDVDQLYKDAYIFHLIRKGFSDRRAEYEVNKFMMLKKKL